MANTYGLNFIKIGGIWIFRAGGGGEESFIRGDTFDLRCPFSNSDELFESKVMCENLVRIGWAFQGLPFEFSGVGAGASFWWCRGGGGELPPSRLMLPPPPMPQLAPHIPQAPRSNSSWFSIIPIEIQMCHHFSITFSYIYIYFFFFCD